MNIFVYYINKSPTTIAKEHSSISTTIFGGWELVWPGDGAVDPLLEGGGGFVTAGGIGGSARSASVRIGLGVAAGGIEPGGMMPNNWPGCAGRA